MQTKNSKKKVLFTSHVANFSKFNRPFMRWFSEQGWEVHYASMGEEEVKDCDKHFTISFARSPFSLDNLKAYKQLKGHLKENHYDIIHTHTPMGSVVTRIAARKARKNGTRVIYTAHGFHFYKGAPILNWLLYFPMEWLLSFITDDLILINSEDFNIAERRLGARRNHWLREGVGVDLSVFKPVSTRRKTELRRRYRYKEADFILVCVAEFTKNKNHRFLISALQKIVERSSGVKLILCGKGDTFNEIQEYASQLGVSTNVDFMGYRDDIGKIMQISDLCVSASMREGLPLNLIEAMSSGLPVVATDCRGNRDLVIDGVSGYTIPLRNIDVFADRVLAFMGSEDLRKEISREATRIARSYSIKNSLRAADLIYLRSIGSDVE